MEQHQALCTLGKKVPAHSDGRLDCLFFFCCFAFSFPSETNLKISGELGWMGMEEETKSGDAGKKGTEAERKKPLVPLPCA